MSLSDAISDAEANIRHYIDDIEDKVFLSRVHEMLCRMIVIRLELDAVRHEELKTNLFYKAALANDYEEYSRLATEFNETFDVERVGLHETSRLQRLKFFFK